MTDAPKLGFTPFARLHGVLVVFCGENLKFGTATQRALAPIGDLVRRAAAADRFTGKNGTTLDIVAPTELKLPRLVVVGTGKDSELKRKDVVKLGGIAMGKVPAVAAEATIFAEFASGALKGDQVADLVLGARLRAYAFDRYKTKRKDDDNRPKKVEVNFACGNPAAAEKAWANASGHRRRRRHRPRSRQRTGERALSRRICPPRLEPDQAWRRRRGARRRGHEEARHGRVARRRAGLGA